MKNCAAVAIAVMVLALTPVAWAQQSCWSDITAWKGSYSLSANASGVSCTGAGPNPGTCNISEQAAANVVLVPEFTLCSLVEARWSGIDSGVIGEVNDSYTSAPCPPHNKKPNELITAAGSQGPASNSYLSINTTSNTFSYAPNNQVGVTWTVTQCDANTSSSSVPYFIAPLNNWPLTSPLPASIDPFVVTAGPFPADSYFDQLIAGKASANWNFSFTLQPTFDPSKDCKKDSKNGDAVSSTVACENQSLGEDVAVVGTGFNLHYESDRNPAAGGNSIASADAAMIGGWTLSVHHAYDPNTNTLFFGDGNQRNGYELGTPLSFNGTLLLTSEDGSEVYVFTPQGQHLQTLRPLTGALVYQFAYDSAGKLITITDATGNVTTIQRNASEQPTAIVSPYGQTTTLALDSNGFLSQVTDPLGKSSTFVNSSTGLLTSRTDPNGNTFTYSYDGGGGLAMDADPLGGYTTLTNTIANTGFSWTVGETTAMGRTSSYQTTMTLPWILTPASSVEEQHVMTWPDGLQATSSKSLASGQLSESHTLPDGTSDSETLGPDPVWGLQVPVELSGTLTFGNLTMNITGSRSTTLGAAGNPFTVTSETDTLAINSRTYTSTFTGSNLTWVNTSPVGRTVNVGLDSLERIASAQVDGLTAADLTYDSHGRLASVTQGTRQTTFSYGSNGSLTSVTDPLQLTTSFAYDADGHPLATTLPDGRVINYTYDANGNLTSVTPPGKSAHDLAYNAVSTPTSYTPPTVLGTGPTTYAYDLDRELTQITRPDGKTITFGYDSGGRLISIGTPTGTASFTYDATTGNMDTAAKGGEQISYSYNGPLPSKSSWKGTVTGSVSRKYNDNFWVASQSVGGGSTIAFQYDNDGLLTKAGSLTIKRSVKNGLITGTTLGVTSDSTTYDSFGDLISYTASVNSAAVYSVNFTRDADGRVTAKTETANGTTNTYSYTYDPASRLTAAATKDGATDTYTYDTNSNRLSATTSSGTSNGTYDAQDRLLTYGNASYTYTANGELASQTVGSQTTTYTYDVMGNLIAATLPNGNKITYVIDAENHRVGKKVNGTLQTGFLYNRGQIVAQLNGSNQIVSQFVYGTGSTSPDYMVSGGVTYRIFSNQLGSPVVVVNSSTGAIAEQITYDEFGNVLSDTSPGFQPFGFAGGLYDQDTQLVRFVARDYNPSVGRWTAKDPMLLTGGDTNLYGYVLADPINLADPTGLKATVCRAGNAIFITLNINYVGPGATPEAISQFNQGIEQAWSGPFGQYYVRTTTASVGDSPNTVYVSQGSDRSSVFIPLDFGHWYQEGWIEAGESPGWTAAHEAGHLLGLDDQYASKFDQYILGKPEGPYPGWEGNIMGQANGKVEQKNIEDILRKNPGDCTCGKSSAASYYGPL